MDILVENEMDKPLNCLEAEPKANPKVSVIVPIYNVEPYLQQCIDSIRCQTVKEIEILLIDDGSSDGCPQMCDHFAVEDDRIRVVHQKNQGVSAARNCGIEMASADWIMFVDADDWLENNAVEILYYYALQSNSDIVSATIFKNYLCNQIQEILNDNECGEYILPRDLEFVISRILHGKPDGRVGLQSACWKIYKSDCINNIAPFPDGMKMYEDRIFNLYAFRSAQKFSVLNIPVYHYRSRKSSTCHSFQPDVTDMVHRYLMEVQIFMRKYQLETEFLGWYRFAVVNTVIYWAFMFGDLIKSAVEFRLYASVLKDLCHEDICLSTIDSASWVTFPHLSFKRRMLLLLLKLHSYRVLLFLCFARSKLSKEVHMIYFQ